MSDIAGTVGADELFNAINEKKLARFKDAIAQVESAGGRNTNHPELEHGIHAGTRAGGAYAVMPTSLKAFVKEGAALGLPIHPHIADLAKKSPGEITAALNNDPELDDQVGDFAARLVLSKAGGDDSKAAFMWNHGHNLDPERLTSRKLAADDYTQKYRSFTERLAAAPSPQQSETAGLAAPGEDSVSREAAPDLSGPSRSGLDLVANPTPSPEGPYQAQPAPSAMGDIFSRLSDKASTFAERVRFALNKARQNEEDTRQI